jgi:hypothetical protein
MPRNAPHAPLAAHAADAHAGPAILGKAFLRDIHAGEDFDDGVALGVGGLFQGQEQVLAGEFEGDDRS